MTNLPHQDTASPIDETEQRLEELVFGDGAEFTRNLGLASQENGVHKSSRLSEKQHQDVSEVQDLDLEDVDDSDVSLKVVVSKSMI